MGVDLTSLSNPSFDVKRWLNDNIQTEITASDVVQINPNHLRSLRTQVHFLIQEVQAKHDQITRQLVLGMGATKKELATLKHQVGSVKDFLTSFRKEGLEFIKVHHDLSSDENSPPGPIETKAESEVPVPNGHSPLSKLVNLLETWTSLDEQRSLVQHEQDWQTLEQQVDAWLNKGELIRVTKRLEAARRMVDEWVPAPKVNDPATAGRDVSPSGFPSRNRGADHRALVDRLVTRTLELVEPQFQELVDECAQLISEWLTTCFASITPSTNFTSSKSRDALFTEWYPVFRRLGCTSQFYHIYHRTMAAPFIKLWHQHCDMTWVSQAEDTRSIFYPRYFWALDKLIQAECDWCQRVIPQEACKEDLVEGLLTSITREMMPHLQTLGTLLASPVSEEKALDFVTELYRTVTQYVTTTEATLMQFRSRTVQDNLGLARNVAMSARGSLSDSDIVSLSDSTSNTLESFAIDVAPPASSHPSAQYHTPESWDYSLLHPFEHLQAHWLEYEQACLVNQVEAFLAEFTPSVVQWRATSNSISGADVLDKPVFKKLSTTLDLAGERVFRIGIMFKHSLERTTILTQGLALVTYEQIIDHVLGKVLVDRLIEWTISIAQLCRFSSGIDWFHRSDTAPADLQGEQSLPYVHTASHQQIETAFKCLQLCHQVATVCGTINDQLIEYIVSVGPQAEKAVTTLEFLAMDASNTLLALDFFANRVFSDYSLRLHGLIDVYQLTEGSGDNSTMISSSEVVPQPWRPVRFLWTTWSLVWCAMLSPLSLPLLQLTTLPDWRHSGSLTERVSSMNVTIPTFSTSPSACVSQIGEYLLAVPQLCDTYLAQSTVRTLLMNVADPWLHTLRQVLTVRTIDQEHPSLAILTDAWACPPVELHAKAATEEELLTDRVTSLAQSVLVLYVHQILCVLQPPLTRRGQQQLLTDMDYLNNIVQTMGVEPVPVFNDLRTGLRALVLVDTSPEALLANSFSRLELDTPVAFTKWLESLQRDYTPDRTTFTLLPLLKFTLSLTAGDVKSRLKVLCEA
ncbi:Golgi transport complex subunit 7 [Dispira simplex]|nr:Golgi transport complex subunit 7 [Dispira simplex]